LKRPEATDQPAGRRLSESQPSLALGLTQAVCRDFFRCLIDTDRPGWASLSRRYSGCRGQVSRKDLEAALGGGRGRAARCRSRSSHRRSFPTTFCAPEARGVPRPMVWPRATGCCAEPRPGYGAPICLCWALPATDPPRTRSNPELGCCSPPWADGATFKLRPSTLGGVAPLSLTKSPSQRFGRLAP